MRRIPASSVTLAPDRRPARIKACFDETLWTHHHLADRLFATLDQKMDVIGHQTVCVKKEGKLVFLYGEQGKKLTIVSLVVKDISMLNPSRDHMIQSALKFNPRLPRHNAGIVISMQKKATKQA